MHSTKVLSAQFPMNFYGFILTAPHLCTLYLTLGGCRTVGGHWPGFRARDPMFIVNRINSRSWLSPYRNYIRERANQLVVYFETERHDFSLNTLPTYLTCAEKTFEAHNNFTYYKGK